MYGFFVGFFFFVFKVAYSGTPGLASAIRGYEDKVHRIVNRSGTYFLDKGNTLLDSLLLSVASLE